MATFTLPRGCSLFNLGNHKPETVNRLIELIENGVKKKAIKNLLPKPEGEILETFADITESQKYLGFSPKTSLEMGMHYFIDWYKQYFNDKNRGFA